MNDITTEVDMLRRQGLSDEQIQQELSTRGYPDYQITEALAGSAALAPPVAEQPSVPPPSPTIPPEPTPVVGTTGGTYERIEEIAETIIDEKWDALLAEVRKIIDWKDKVEDDVKKAMDELANLKERFKELHEGVLGKVEEYDKRMMEVGTELKAVGKVFKDVIPQFTDNVKELSSITKTLKGQQKKEP
jgi:ABC-type transporter Mla subunit MlaD